MKFVLEILLTGLAILALGQIIPGVKVDSYSSAVIAGVLIGFVNATVGLLLRILTFPLNILTLGLVSFIISVLMILLVDHLMDSFEVHGFFTACLFAISLALMKMLIHILEGSKKK